MTDALRKVVWAPTLVVLAVAPVTFARDSAWGTWQDGDGSNIYEFRANHEFKYQGIKKVFVEYRGLRPNLSGNIPGLNRERGQFSQQRVEFSGAWEAGERVCTSSGADSEKTVGNLKLYVGSVECCMEAKRLGSTLILRALRGDSATGKDDPELCANRTLRQEEAAK